MAVTASQLLAVVNVTGAAEAQARLLGVGVASDEAGARLRNMIVGGTVLAGVALVALGAKSIQMAGNFQQATNQLVTSAGESRANIDKVRQGILNLSTSTATSWQQLTAGMFNVESAGYRSSQALEVLKAAAEGARAENADLASTTAVLTTAMHNFHIPASQAVTVMDSLITTVANGQMHMDDLTGALKNVLPVASAFHIQLSNVEGALDTMALSGDKGTAAGTHLAMMFKMLANPTGQAASEMRAMGLDSIKLAQTMQTSLPDALAMIQNAVARHFTPGSVEYNRAIQTILGGSKSGIAGLELMGQNFKSLQQNTDAAAAALRKGGTDVENWDVIQSNFNFKLEAAKNAVVALMIGIGTKLLPVVSGLLDTVTPAISAFSNWATAMMQGSNAVKWLGDNAQIVLPLLAGLAAMIGFVLVPAVWSLAAGVIAATWPLLAIGAAVAGVVAILVYAYNHWTAFRTVVNTVASALAQAASYVVANFMPAMQQVGAFVSGVFTSAWHGLQSAISTVSGVVNQAAGVFNQFIGTARQVASTVGGALASAWQVLQGPIALVISIFQKVWGIVVSQVMPALHQTVSTIQSNLIPAWNGLQQILTQVGRTIQNAIVGVMPMVNAAIQSFSNTWKQLQPVLAAILPLVGPVLLGALKVLAVVIGGTIVAAIILFISTLAGIAVALSRIILGVTQFVSGFIRLFTGMAQIVTGVVTGFFNVLVDIFTGQWGKIGSDTMNALNLIASGAQNVMAGMWSMIQGLFTASIGAVIGFFQGFVTTLIGIAESLYHALVGGSIFPDLVHGIIAVFQVLLAVGLAIFNAIRGGILAIVSGLMGSAIGLARSLVSGVISAFSSLIGQAAGVFNSVRGTVLGVIGGLAGAAFSAAQNVVQSIINGLSSKIGGVTATISNIASTIRSYLPFSPAKEGPLRDLDKSMPALVRMLTRGLEQGVPELHLAMRHLVTPIATPLGARPSSSSAFPLGLASFGSGGSPSTTIENHIHVHLDGHEMAGVLAPQIVNHLRRKTGVRV